MYKSSFFPKKDVGWLVGMMVCIFLQTQLTILFPVKGKRLQKLFQIEIGSQIFGFYEIPNIFLDRKVRFGVLNPTKKCAHVSHHRSESEEREQTYQPYTRNTCCSSGNRHVSYAGTAHLSCKGTPGIRKAKRMKDAQTEFQVVEKRIYLQ